MREIRDKLGLSRSEFADQLYVTEKYVYLIETGRKPPSQRFLRMIGLRFGVQIARMEGDIPASERAPLDLLDWLASDVTAQDFFRVWQELDRAGQEAVRRYAECIRAGDEETNALVDAEKKRKDELVKHFSMLLAKRHVREIK